MRAALVDFETTGLTKPSVSGLDKQPHIIEVGIAVYEEGVLVHEYSRLVKPPFPISEEITKITGITNEMLEGQPPFSEIIGDIADAFDGCDAFVAHNAPFDRACLEYEIQRLGCFFAWPPLTICSAQEFTHEFGFRPKLVQLYALKMGKPLEQTHRALDDVKAMAEVLLKEGLI